jgi:2-furoyl-CoA dehydrogenase FAD binding subunit
LKPARFDYLRAGTLAEAHATLAADGEDARILAGGQSLLPMLSMRMARPKVLIDIMHLPELAKIEADANAMRIGAGVRQAKLLAWPALHERQPLLAAALPWVGHAQTRSRGTVCGSVAHADPSAEIPLVLLALKGAIHLSSRQKQRRVPAVDFFTGIMSTARNDDELIEGIEAPCRTPGHGYAFREFGRRHGDFAIVACAAVAHADGLRSAASLTAPPSATIPISPALRSMTRSTDWPGSSTRGTICTQPGVFAAISSDSLVGR